jgi:shikimate dehydrogenase
MDIYGVIGWPIKHSLSPAMHNAAFKKLGIKAEYRLFEVKPEDLEDFIFNRKDVIGFNITVPHKIKAREILEKNPEAPIKHAQSNVILTGAVNTAKRTASVLEYCNTDVLGFQTALKEDLRFDVKNKIVLLIGCGGAGRAVIAALNNIRNK